MSLQVRNRAEVWVPDAVYSRNVMVGPSPLSSEAGRELDREIERRVFAKPPGRAVPPFSTEDWTATALAQLVSRQTGWTCEVSEHAGTWSAIWLERPNSSTPPARQKILAMITASAPTRALAICRALIKATRCPRWPGVSPAASGGKPSAREALGAGTSPGSRNRP